jgi:uncharacterized protein (DUF2062 family)
MAGSMANPVVFLIDRQQRYAWLSALHLSCMPTLSHRSLAARLAPLLRQGLAPEKLALSLALGIALSCFPIFGTTTILCALVALVFRLNLPAIQVGNYLALPLQLALFIPFLRLGERLLRAPKAPLSPEQLLTMAKNQPDQTMRILLAGQWHSILGWAVIAPAIMLLSYLIARPLMQLVVSRANRAESPATITVRR